MRQRIRRAAVVIVVGRGKNGRHQHLSRFRMLRMGAPPGRKKNAKTTPCAASRIREARGLTFMLRCSNAAAISDIRASALPKGHAMLKGKSVVVTGSTSGIGLAIARAFAREGANLTINGFGDKAAIEKERAGIEKEFGVKAIYSGADMTKPAEIAEMIDTTEKTFGARRCAGEQCRHPVRREGRGFPDREMGRRDRDQSLGRVPHHARRDPRHEEAQMGPHHQHRVGARPRRERREGGLRRGEARHRRPHQGGGDRGRE